MISVTQEQLEKVQYLIGQSAIGNHILFEPEAVRKAFSLPPEPIQSEKSKLIGKQIETLIGLETLEKQKAFLDRLDDATLHLIIRTYFNIVENNLYENGSEKH